MMGPPRKERGLGGTALKADWNNQEYHHAGRVQTSMRRHPDGPTRLLQGTTA